MDTETDCSSFSDNLESGYSTLSDELLNTTVSCQSTDEETCLMKTAENIPIAAQSDQNISAFIPLMPTELRNDLIDVLIICQHSDMEGAEIFKEEIQTLNIKAEVLDCSVVHSKQLNDLYKRSLLYFLYVTEAFCKCTETVFKSHISLAETLKGKEINIVPVYICHEEKIDLDVTLKYLNPIRHYTKDKDIKNMKKILEGKKRQILKRDTDLEKRREEYFQENKAELTLLLNKEKTHSKKSINDDRSEQTNLNLLPSNTINDHNLLSSQCEMPCKKSKEPISEDFVQGLKSECQNVDDKKSQANVINKIKKVFNITIQNVTNMTIEDNQVVKEG